MVEFFDIVVACDRQGGIGKEGRLPWRLSGDLQYFKQLTTQAKHGAQNAVIMGRKTWESIPEKRRPLPGRINAVITRNESFPLPGGVLRAASLNDALEQMCSLNVENCFVVGGGEIYRQAVTHPKCRRLYLTRVEADFDCDTVFPHLGNAFDLQPDILKQEENGLKYAFMVYERKK